MPWDERSLRRGSWGPGIDITEATDATPPEEIAIVVRGLTKRFGDVYAVNGIDLDVPRGSFFGLVGPNGAGKSTTLSMVTGLLRPDAGAVWIEGNNIANAAQEVKRDIGVLPEELLLFERLTGGEMLDYTGRLRELDAEVIEHRSAQLLDVLGLSGDADKLVVDYSQGMRKKISLAVALLHAPKVLFLDEPFESVDPISVRSIRSVLADYTAGGSTIVFSSHVMPLVEQLCDRVAVMHNGRVVATGPTAEVRGAGRLEDAFARLVGAGDVASGSLEWLQRSPG